MILSVNVKAMDIVEKIALIQVRKSEENSFKAFY